MVELATLNVLGWGHSQSTMAAYAVENYWAINVTTTLTRSDFSSC